MFEGIKKWWQEFWNPTPQNECGYGTELDVLPKPEPKFFQPTDPRLEFETGKTYEKVVGSLTVMFEEAPEPELQQPISDAPPELIVPKVRIPNTTPVDVEPMVKAVVEELNGDIEYRNPPPYPEARSIAKAVEILGPNFAEKRKKSPVKTAKKTAKKTATKAPVKTEKKTTKKKAKK